MSHIAHLDVKPDNIVIDGNFTAILIVIPILCGPLLLWLCLRGTCSYLRDFSKSRLMHMYPMHRPPFHDWVQCKIPELAIAVVGRLKRLQPQRLLLKKPQLKRTVVEEKHVCGMKPCRCNKFDTKLRNRVSPRFADHSGGSNMRQ